ncbi:MAG: MurR/RpiR family transcriptional regulator [Eubacteriales bacterium]|nr:MurR/RpiR family transcriptional regulator [Eubacteriales bacterium]
MAGLILKIKELYDQFGASEKRAADLVLKDPQAIVGIPISTFAEKSGTHKTAVLRLCRKLGYSGYRDFILNLVSELAVNANNEDTGEYIDLNVGDNLTVVAKNVCINNQKAIEDSYKIINVGDVIMARDLLMNAKKINFFGIGASGVVALDAHREFTRINKNCTISVDYHQQLATAANSTQDDVAVVISWSGETKEMIRVAKTAKEAGAKVIIITRLGKNRLAEYADIKLSLSAPETTIRCGATSSRIAQLTMIDILFNSILTHDYSNLKKYLDKAKTTVRRPEF